MGSKTGCPQMRLPRLLALFRLRITGPGSDDFARAIAVPLPAGGMA